MRGKITKTLQSLSIEIPDLDNIEKKHHKKESLLKKMQFKKQKTVILTKDKVFIQAPGNSSCIFCNSTNFVKHGKRHNTYSIIQMYWCKNCQRKFSFNVGFVGSRFSADTISQTLQLYFTGESLRDICKFFKMQGIKVSHNTVHNWIKKYIKLMHVFLDQFTPQVSDSWRCDEIYVKIKGNPKYLFVLMDDETRFILAYYIADTKKTQKANRLFEMAIAKAGKHPKTFTSDSLLSYKKAFGQVFDPKVTEHIRVSYSTGTKWKNNLMESWNGKFRHREKTFRGIKRKNSVTIIGFILYYNFIREHMVLKSTPAEKAGIHIEGNKWITLIQNATMENENLWKL